MKTYRIILLFHNHFCKWKLHSSQELQELEYFPRNYPLTSRMSPDANILLYDNKTGILLNYL